MLIPGKHKSKVGVSNNTSSLLFVLILLLVFSFNSAYLPSHPQPTITSHTTQSHDKPKSEYSSPPSSYYNGISWEARLNDPAKNYQAYLAGKHHENSAHYSYNMNTKFVSPGTPHDPINIFSDQDFAFQGWPGNGTKANPYRIDGLDINCSSLTGYGIQIHNTQVFFQVNGCSFLISDDRNDFCCILLDNVTHSNISDNSFVSTELVFSYGIHMTNSSSQNLIQKNSFYYLHYAITCHEACSNNTFFNNEFDRFTCLTFTNANRNYIHNNTFIRYSDFFLSHSNENLITNNTFELIGLSYSDGNRIVDNNISIRTYSDQVGIYQSQNNTFLHNDFHAIKPYSGPIEAGLILMDASPQNYLINNSFNELGLKIEGPTVASCRQGAVMGNTVYGNPLRYFQDQTSGLVSERSGQVILVNCLGMVVRDQILINVSVGIHLLFSTYTTLLNNSLLGVRFTFSFPSGILLTDSNDIHIENNSLVQYYHGIELQDSHHVIIEGNNCTDTGNGIYLEDCTSVNVTRNNLRGYFWWWRDDAIYIRDCHDITASSNIVNEAGSGIALESSFHVTVRQNLCVANEAGISILGSDDNVAEQNKLLENEYGLLVSGSAFNVITNNTLTHNTVGASFFASNSNIITLNVFLNNTFEGLTILASYGHPSCTNLVDMNIFETNLCGLALYHGGIDTTVTGNVFLANHHPETGTCYNVFDDGHHNTFDMNYYSDYTGPDFEGDGLGDWPYKVPGSSGQVDFHPLLLPLGSPPIWLNAPTEIMVFQGTLILYDFDATAYPPGILTYTVNDTAHFTITDWGLLSTLYSLSPGTYYLTITAHSYDGKTITTSLIINVQPFYLNPSFTLVIGLALIVIIGLTITLQYRRRHQP